MGKCRGDELAGEGGGGGGDVAVEGAGRVVDEEDFFFVITSRFPEGFGAEVEVAKELDLPFAEVFGGAAVFADDLVAVALCVRQGKAGEAALLEEAVHFFYGRVGIDELALFRGDVLLHLVEGALGGGEGSFQVGAFAGPRGGKCPIGGDGGGQLGGESLLHAAATFLLAGGAVVYEAVVLEHSLSPLGEEVRQVS